MRKKKKTAKQTYSINTKKYAHFFPNEEHVQKEQIQMSHEAVYSVTKPDKAKTIKQIMIRHLNQLDKQPSNCIITDATACVGGDTLSFSTYFKRVQSVEMNPTHYSMLKNNIDVYKRKNVDVYLGDYVRLMPKLKQDIVFIDPPWGGPSYKSKKNLKLQLSTTPIYKVIQFLYNKVSMIVLKTPVNFDINSIFEYTSFKTKKPQYQNIHVYHLVNMLIIVLITKKV